jgi:hypothetical protein
MQIVGSSTGLGEVSEWTLWRGWPRTKQKKRHLKHSSQNGDDGGTLGLTRALSGNRSERAT